MWIVIILFIVSFIVITGLKIEKVNLENEGEYDIIFYFTISRVPYKFTMHRRWIDLDE